MNASLVHQGLDATFSEKVIAKIEERRLADVTKKTHSAILLSLGDEVLQEEAEEKYAKAVWDKLEDLYLKKTLANRLYLKKHLDDFNKIILELKSIDV